MIIGLSMFVPCLCSFYYGEVEAYAFLLSAALVLVVSMVAYKKTEPTGVTLQKEVFCTVALGWLLAALFGSLPYLISGTFVSFADAFFETMSGFATTGATVLADVESLPRGILFWRSMTHWLGGMGIIVLFVALLSSLGTGGEKMFLAESPGGSILTKLTPRISDSAKILWGTYLILTIAEIILLFLFGMPIYDAVCHTFSNVSTGGFSVRNGSIGFYGSPQIEWVIIIITFLSGANFALYYRSVREKSLAPLRRNSEFRLYSLIIVLAAGLIAYNLYTNGQSGLGDAIRQAAFQVVSIMTTTGFVTEDFNQWPIISMAILFMLMFIGGCAGSTSGGVKVGRILVMFKQTILELRHQIHPRAVIPLKIDGEVIDREKVMTILQFFFVYTALILVGLFFMSFQGLDLVTAFTAVVAALGNVGPGLGAVGPASNYGFISDAGKYFLSFYMLIGRLELFTVLVLFLPSFWRKE
jgi:trk system potassium uptake protein TrkH